MRFAIGLFFILIGFSALTGLSLTKYFFAFLLIFIGVRILTGKKSWFKEESKYRVISSSNADYLNEVLVFSSTNRVVKSKNFKGGKVVVVFGGGKLDLKEIETKQDEIEIEAVAIFGELKLLLPKNMKVHSEGVGVIGSYNDRVSGKTSGVKTLRVKGAAVFGEVDLLN